MLRIPLVKALNDFRINLRDKRELQSRQHLIPQIAKCINDDTTVISNNCFAGRIMQDLNMKYNSPTLGLYIWTPDYIEFVSKLRYYLTEAKLTFVKHSKYPLGDERRSKWSHWYPIGLLDGKVEIQFLHYHSEKEAAEKWYRRAGRINWNNIMVIGMEQNLCTIKDIYDFDKLPVAKKVIFTSRNLSDVKSNIYLKEFDGRDEVGDAYRFSDVYYRGLIEYFFKTMKILVINTVPTDKNGITNVIFNYLKAMGNDVAFDYVAINNPDAFYVNFLEEKGAALYSLKRRNVLGYIGALCKIIKKNKYDAIHVHGNSHTVVLELLAAKLAGCKVRIIHAHSTGCNSVALHKLLAGLFDCLCTDRLACGESAGKFMFGLKPFEIINNGVDVEKFSFDNKAREVYRIKLALTETDILIGHVGYFMPVKNQSFLVDVFAELVKNDSRYHLVLIGDGAMRTEIEQKVASLGLTNKVTFTGNIDNVSEFLNAIDIIIMPSLYEGLPLTLVEQQANGLQCVVSDTITSEADKTGNLRFLSLQTPISDWVHTIENSHCMQDREQRSKDAIVAIEKAGYSIQREAKKLVEYYKKIC